MVDRGVSCNGANSPFDEWWADNFVQELTSEGIKLAGVSEEARQDALELVEKLKTPFQLASASNPALLNQYPAIARMLVAKKVVAMRAKAPVVSLPQYDQELMKEDVKLPTVSQRPVSSVVTTVSE